MPASRYKETAVLTAGVTMVALIGITGLLVRLVAAPDVRPGDIIAFTPTDAWPPGSFSRFRVIRDDGVACVLDVREIYRGGGSLMVEGARSDGAYRLHWIGDRTARGIADCGGDAEISIAPDDLTTLMSGLDYLSSAEAAY